MPAGEGQTGSPDLPLFDCRVFQVPTDFEAVNCFIWREQDATRNSVQMAARAALLAQRVREQGRVGLQEMLFKRRASTGTTTRRFFKRGTYVRRRELETSVHGCGRWTPCRPSTRPARNPDLRCGGSKKSGRETIPLTGGSTAATHLPARKTTIETTGLRNRDLPVRGEVFLLTYREYIPSPTLSAIRGYQCEFLLSMTEYQTPTSGPGSHELIVC
jgi:hypothetical protein